MDWLNCPLGKVSKVLLHIVEEVPGMIESLGPIRLRFLAYITGQITGWMVRVLILDEESNFTVSTFGSICFQRDSSSIHIQILHIGRAFVILKYSTVRRISAWGTKYIHLYLHIQSSLFVYALPRTLCTGCRLDNGTRTGILTLSVPVLVKLGNVKRRFF